MTIGMTLDEMRAYVERDLAHVRNAVTATGSAIEATRDELLFHLIAENNRRIAEALRKAGIELK